MSIQTNVPRETSPLLTGNKLTRSQSSSWLDSPSSPSHPRQGRIIDVEIKDENTTNSNDGQNSLLGAIFIIVNACLGAGVLNFPSAYSSAGGISISVALQVILVLFAALALLVLAFCADIHGSTTYENSVASLCGPKILLACQATVILYSFGACITYMIIVADQTDKVMEFIAGSHYSQNWYTNRKFTLTLVSFILILPLCFPKKIEFLKYSSILGVLATFYVVVVVIIKYYINERRAVPISHIPQSWIDVFIAVPAICFGFQCHLCAVPVYASLQQRSVKHFSKVVAAAMMINFTVYLLTGIYGYLTFGDNVESDILLSYSATDIAITIARIMIMASVLTSYPILSFVGRAAIMGTLSSIGGNWLYILHYRERLFRIVETLIWFIASLSAALFIPNIGMVISVIGSLAGTFILLYPGLCLFQAGLLKVTSSKHTNRALTFTGFIFIVLGTFLFGESLTMSLMNNIKGT